MLKAPRFLHGLNRFVEVEEHVGRLWHRLMARTAIKHYPQAGVYLNDVQRTVGIVFRALGGDGGLKIQSTTAIDYAVSQTLLQRIAGSNTRFELAWRNNESLNLPAHIDLFPEHSLNYDLFIWLAALAAGDYQFKYADKNHPNNHFENWLDNNQKLSCHVLHRFPGLKSRYQRLVTAQLALRPNIKNLTEDEANIELVIKAVLQNPNKNPANTNLTSPHLPQPVYLWLYPAPALATVISQAKDDKQSPESNGESLNPEQQRRYQAENVEMPNDETGLVLDRFENIFSWAEYINVDRSTDEDEDLSTAEAAANDLEQLSIARDNKAAAKRIRFDLDLPALDSDDTPLTSGILLPEWDYRKKVFVKDYCSLQEMVANIHDVHNTELPLALRHTARRLRSQFESLKPSRIWYRGQQDGSEVDLDAYLDFVTEPTQAIAEQGLYREFRGAARDMACLLLADLSLSTDAWVNDHARIIDVIRDSLFLFSEALSACGDQFAMYGFSSRYREHIRYHTLKTFSEKYNAVSRSRIHAIKPGFYTRMGAAIRHASNILQTQSASRQLLLLLTDGKPNDLDQYDGRYGVEDTRMALIEARRKGLQVFCVTIDQQAGDYLPYMFGTNNYVVIRNPSELPRELPLLYARLSR